MAIVMNELSLLSDLATNNLTWYKKNGRLIFNDNAFDFGNILKL